MTHVNLIKCTDQKGSKAEVDKIQYSKDGKLIMIGTKDGSLQGYSTQIFHRPAFCMRGKFGLNIILRTGYIIIINYSNLF